MASNLELSDDVVLMLQKQNDFLFEHLNKLKTENLKLHQRIQKHRWGHKLFEVDDKTVEYLTGCSSYGIFISLVESINVPHSQRKPLSPANQLLLTLMKVKLHVPDVYLRALFRGTNVTEVLSMWLPQLEDSLFRLIRWPPKEGRPIDYFVKYFTVKLSLTVAVVFTSSGSICHVSNVDPFASISLLEDETFLRNIRSKDRILDLKTGEVHIATRSGQRGVKFSQTIKHINDMMGFSYVKHAILKAIDKLQTFAIFSQNINEFRYIDRLVLISAALVNLHPLLLPDCVE